MICRTLNHFLRSLCLLAFAFISFPSNASAQSNTKPAQGASVEQIIIVFKTHFDIGYTDMASNVVQRYRTTMIDDALKVVDQNRNLPMEQQFAWTMPGWPVSKILENWPGQSAERQKRATQAFKDGRFLVHSLPFSTHTELLESEDLVHGLGYSSRITRSLGLELPRDAKMTDVPCHSWILPTLLKNAGIVFLHLGCNAASSSPQVPPLFWWEGPDGSRLLTMYTGEGYGTGLVAPKDWPHKTWLALTHTGDNHGPPTPEEVKTLLAQAREKMPCAKVRIGRLSDFADAILAEKPELPVVRGDMPDTWIHGPMSDPAGAKLARNLRPVISHAEALHTMLELWGLKVPDVAGPIAKAREQSLLYGEHTWGGAQYWVTQYGSGTKWGYAETWKKDHDEGRFKRLEDSWAEHSAYIENARDIITPILDADLITLAKAVGVEGTRVVVYNPLPWPRGGLVTVKAPASKIAGLRAVDTDEIVPIEIDGSMARFVTREIPAMGYRTFVPAKIELGPSPLKSDSQATTLESPWFKLTLNSARGTISSLIDKKSGRELVDPSAPHGLGQYLYERFDADQIRNYVKAYVKIDADWAVNELGKPSMPPASQVSYAAASPTNFALRIEQTPVSVTATMDAAVGSGLNHRVTSRVILRRDQPSLDIEITVNGKPADPWPEAGWICLPFKIDAPQFRLGRLGSIIDPARDIVPGCNFDMIALNTGLTVTDDHGNGVGLCPIDHPLVSLGEPGCWRYSKTFTPRKSRVYVNLFNNQWTTNFRMWNEGSWTSRVRLWSTEGADAAKNLVTPSEEARSPLMAVLVDGAGGTLPAKNTGFELPQGINLTALSPNPDGEGCILRIWEEAGVKGEYRVYLPDSLGPRYIYPLDLRGRSTGDRIQADNHSFKVLLNKFAPATFKFSR